MRVLVLCAVVVAALAAVPKPSVQNIQHFRKGYTYRYAVDTQLSNGLVVPGSDIAISRAQMKVALSFPEEHQPVLSFDSIRVAHAQRDVDSKTLQPFESLEKIHLNEEHERVLSLPVRFRYERGLVSEIEFDREDSVWSENIKRAVLNMLQVNLAKSEEVYEKEMSEKRREVTVEGECGVLYTIVPASEEQKEMRVTKSIDFENCEASGRVGARYAFRFGDECKSCPENKFNGAERNIESSTVLNYRIAGSESRFVIREVELRSSYVYSPISENDSLFSTIALGKMTLLEESQESEKVTLPKSEKKETLAYNQEWERAEEKFISEGADELLKQMPYPEMKNKAEVVKRLVKSLVEKIQSEELGVDAAATHEMGRIVTVLRLASKDDLARIHKEICENDDSKFGQEQRDIINDALALAGTANTIQHLMEKIRERQVSPARTAVIFKHLVNVRVPSQKIVDSIVSVCRDLKAQPVQRQSCWLTAGSLMTSA